MSDENGETDVMEVSAKEASLLESLRSRNVSAEELQSKLEQQLDKGASSDPKPAKPAEQVESPAGVTPEEAQKMADKAAQAAVGTMQEQQAKKEAFTAVEGTIRTAISGEKWIGDDPVERRAISELARSKMMKLPDVQKLGNEDFTKALTKAAQEAAKERREAVVAKAAAVKGVDPAAAAHGQASPGEPPPRSDVPSASQVPGTMVTPDNLSDMIGQFTTDGSVKYPSPAGLKLSTHKASANFLRQQGAKK